MKEGEPEKEGKLQIEGDRLPLLGGGERERERDRSGRRKHLQHRASN